MKTRNHLAAAATLVVSALVCSAAAFADSASQAERLANYEWLRARTVFRSVTVAGGVVQLVLGPHGAPEHIDRVSLGIYCRIVFDYYAELDPRNTRLLVIDGATGATVGFVDARGFHPN